ncbi:hypothetical protein M5K25_009099 [Dendrobium thyrsiflorum]|uniref:Uncharacterized protein n=1 Tax=Dendrobium thyrsiflorum TaxID=117978 RepID=A0ABD0VBK5_DENTH
MAGGKRSRQEPGSSSSSKFDPRFLIAEDKAAYARYKSTGITISKSINPATLSYPHSSPSGIGRGGEEAEEAQPEQVPDPVPAPVPLRQHSQLPSYMASSFWKDLCKLAHSVKVNISLIITADSNMSFYWDPWLDGISIHDMALNVHSRWHDIFVKDVIVREDRKRGDAGEEDVDTIKQKFFNVFHRWNEFELASVSESTDPKGTVSENLVTTILSLSCFNIVLSAGLLYRSPLLVIDVAISSRWGLLLSPSTISASSSSLRISEFVLLSSPLFATDAVVWLCTSNIFFIISRRSATCPSMEDIRSSTVVLIWFISPSSRSSKASTFLAAIAPGFEKNKLSKKQLQEFIEISSPLVPELALIPI